MQLLQFSQNDELVEDDQIEENIESFTEYENGSHYMAHIGEVLINRYVLIEKIGKGNFSIVWLAKDFKNNQHVALKIIKQDQKYYEQGLDEIIIMQHLQQIENENIIKLQNSFIHTNQIRNHLVLCFEILGISVFEIIQEMGPMDVELVKQISKQLLIGLDQLEGQGIIHCDLKPQNILISLSEEQMIELSITDNYPSKKAQLDYIKTKIKSLNFKIIDFGSSCFINKHYSNTIQTLNYRAPEVICGCFYSNKADVWSFGCLIYELITGQKLFQYYEDDFESQIQMLNQIQMIFGDFNEIIKHAGTFSKEYFNKQGQLIQIYKQNNLFIKKLSSRLKQKDFIWLKNLLYVVLDPNHLQRPNFSDIVKWKLLDSNNYLKVLKIFHSEEEKEKFKKYNTKKIFNSHSQEIYRQKSYVAADKQNI